MKIYIYKYITCLAITLLMMVSCSSDDSLAVSPSEGNASNTIAFKAYIGSSATRTTYPNTFGSGTVGAIDNDRLKVTGFGVFAQHTGDEAWSAYGKGVPFNFMWNQQVGWDEALSWTYSPVKYWPNDNQPADNQGAQGSKPHSYLDFFAYAPYVNVANPGEGFDVKDVDENHDNIKDHDGIVAVSHNNTGVNASYIYYRTSNTQPYSPTESVDLLWATQQDMWKMKESGEGYVDGQVHLTFRHALSKLDVYTKAMIDRTEDLTHDAYPTTVDVNTKIFIDNVSINTPTLFPEGKLMVGLGTEAPYWDYTGITGTSGFLFNSNTDDKTPDISYSLRYAAPNIPTEATITDEDDDNLDDATGLTVAGTAKAAFDAMAGGVTDVEAQLAADNATLMFPPSAAAGALSVKIKYHVVTYDANLTLNSPKFYSDVTNDITATLNESGFKFEANKHYKLVLNLGLTSVKFDVYVLDDGGEYILLSSVVKSWDVTTKEYDVE